MQHKMISIWTLKRGIVNLYMTVTSSGKKHGKLLCYPKYEYPIYDLTGSQNNCKHIYRHVCELEDPGDHFRLV